MALASHQPLRPGSDAGVQPAGGGIVMPHFAPRYWSACARSASESTPAIMKTSPMSTGANSLLVMRPPSAIPPGAGVSAFPGKGVPPLTSTDEVAPLNTAVAVYQVSAPMGGPLTTL